MKTTAGVSSRAGTTISIALSAEPMKPVRSAMPIPSIPTSTMPSGAKLMKFLTMLEIAQYRPSRVRMFSASYDLPVVTHSTCASPAWPSAVVCSGRRSSTTQCVLAATAEAIITSTVPMRNSVAGSGR